MTEFLKERWTQLVAMTTTVLAVCAAISALKGGGYSTKVQLNTTKEANTWAYFQAKSTKQHVTEAQRDTIVLAKLQARDPKVRAWADQTLAKYDKDIARYGQEKEQIQKDALSYEKEGEVFKRHSGFFGLAVMLLQIAIMLSSVSALVKRMQLWFVGLAFGVGGLGYMLAGFLL